MRRLFVYGALADGDDASWLADLPRSQATTRGSLWMDARRRPVLVPEPLGERIPGLLVEVDEARHALVTLMLGGPPEGTPSQAAAGAPGWLPVVVAVGLRPVHALAWGVATPTRARVGRLRPPVGRRP